MEENSKVNEIRRVSDFVNDILEQTPSWIIAWGNTLFVGFIGLIFLLAWFIQYPDILYAEVEITSDPPPIGVVTKVDGLIDSLPFKDKDFVKKGQLIMSISSVADPQKVVKIKSLIVELDQFREPVDFISFSLPKIQDLGMLSDLYYSLYKEFNDFKNFLKKNNVFINIRSYQIEINEIKNLNQSLHKQELIFAESFELRKKNLARSKKLSQDGLISDIDLELVQEDFLLEKRSLEEFRSRQIRNNIDIERLQTRMKDLKSERWEEYSSRFNQLKQNLSLLEEGINNWEDRHIIHSPMDGHISMAPTLTVDKHVVQNNVIAHIVPRQQDNHLVAYLDMAQTNSSGIDIGSKVQIRIDAYPYEDYGVIETVVSDQRLLRTIIEGSSHTILTCRLPSILVTTHQDTIPFTQGLSGRAILLKKEQNLLNRIFNRIYSGLSK